MSILKENNSKTTQFFYFENKCCHRSKALCFWIFVSTTYLLLKDLNCICLSATKKSLVWSVRSPWLRSFQLHTPGNIIWSLRCFEVVFMTCLEDLVRTSQTPSKWLLRSSLYLYLLSLNLYLYLTNLYLRNLRRIPDKSKMHESQPNNLKFITYWNSK